MQLSTLLLVVTGILTLLSGIAVYGGSKKQERKAAKYFTLSTLATAGWGLSIAAFMALTPENVGMEHIVIFGVYGFGLFVSLPMFAYLMHSSLLGKIFAWILTLGAMFMCGALLYDHSLLYSGVTLSPEGNSVSIVDGWYYIAYSIFLIISTSVSMFALMYRIKKARSKAVKTGFAILLVSMGIGGTCSLIFDVILPRMRYDLIWVGPFLLGFSMIAFYYATLRYKMISLSGRWLKILSYAIMICAAAIIYMIIFYIVFTALFKVPNPSTSIFVLNFIMIVIVLLLFPVINELTTFTNSLIHTNQVDLAYIVKKLNSMTTNTNLNELSEFLADHMHFTYIGLIVDGKLYGSSALPLSGSELSTITKLKKNPTANIWQELSDPVKEIFDRSDLMAVAELNDAKGKAFGQILVGKPLGKMSFERKDLVQIEMVINLVAAMIDTKAK
ncbi:MAG: hypothetical protein Q4E47_00900 [Candidatus Saccharibacteria bacterium]|nr:hypothetical protein [Candidatus Saccharibacteria bacterium]